MALGESDFGLYNVVGSIVVFITFLNGVLSASVTRFYAYAIGQARNMDAQEACGLLRMWFNTALSLYTIVPAALIAIGYPIGVYAIGHWLTIPVERLGACVWVFRISLVTAFVSMVSVPFIAFYTAYQYIVELSFWGMLNTALVFCSAYVLIGLNGDHLVWYAIIMMLIHAGIPICQCVRACCKFKGCRIHLPDWYNAKCCRQLFSFAWWQFFGNCGALMQSQACAVLTNIYFGPKVNAAYGISSQVSSKAGTLTQAMIGAFTPAVTSAEGEGKRSQMIDMAWKASRYGTFLVLLFLIPLAVEIDEVLRLWLKNPPPLAAALCMVGFVEMVFGKLTVGHQIAIAAQGRIAAYQAVLGTLLILALPISWGLVLLGVGPMSVVFALLLTTTFCSIGRVVFGRIQLNMSVRYWLFRVVAPMSLLCALSGSVGCFVRYFMEVSFLRICVTTALTLFSSLILGWCVILNADERDFLIRRMRNVGRR